jgi:hypothetical protein
VRPAVSRAETSFLISFVFILSCANSIAFISPSSCILQVLALKEQSSHPQGPGIAPRGFIFLPLILDKLPHQVY